MPATTGTSTQTSPELSCTVSIQNSLSAALTYSSSLTKIDKGSWGSDPPSQIAAGQTSSSFTLVPPAGQGCNATVVYQATDSNGVVDFSFYVQCSVGDGVKVECTAQHSGKTAYKYAMPFTASVGGVASPPNQSPTSSGAPLTVNFEVCYRIQEILSAGAFHVLDQQGTPISGNTVWSGPTMDVGGGVTTPALFGGPPTGICLYVAVTNDGTNLGRLYGRQANNGPFLFTSGHITASGIATTQVAVSVQCQNNPTIACCCSQIVWDFGDPSEPIESTELQLYWAFAGPQSMWATGVWIQVLEDIYGLFNDFTGVTEAGAVQTIVQACFSGSMGNGAYQKTYGFPGQFGGFWSGSAFALARYRAGIGRDGNPCTHANCQDQAFLVGTVLGAIGILPGIVLVTFAPSTSNLTIGETVNSNIQILPGVTIPASLANLPLSDWIDHFAAAYIPAGSVTGNILDATLGPALATQNSDAYLATTFAKDANASAGTPGTPGSSWTVDLTVPPPPSS